MLWVWCILSALCTVVAAPTENYVSRSNSMLETITSNGYVAETHNVTTEDGYILGVYRIPYPRYQTSGNDSAKPVVFCMHGLYGQSQNFIALQPELAFGFNLADAGFDVWFGNARGNVHSRAHVTLDPNSPDDVMEFFDFSWEEVGMYDLPAMIDYILEFTGQEKLHYIGHSQGGTTFLVLGSMRPEYNEKLASVNLLAGVGYMEYFPNEELKSIAQLTDIIYALVLSEGLVELTPDLVDLILGTPNPADQQPITRADLCFGDIKYKHMCALIGAQHFMRDDTVDPNFGGGSVKQIAHYGQNIRDKLFKRFDYGSVDNQARYGTSTPPLYDLGLITSNVVMHYTVSDDLLDERDVLDMAADMPHTVVRKVARDTFGHSDFVVADDAKALVTDYIIEYIWNVHNGSGQEEDFEDAPEEKEEIVMPTLAPVEEEVVPGSAVHISLSLILKMYLLICTFYIML